MGRVTGGTYRILAHLRGADAADTSLVALAGTQELAVVKRLKLGADAEPQDLAHFADEARLCGRLAHANVTKLLEAGQDSDGPLLVFEYLEGVTLARLRSRAIRKSEGVPVKLAIRIVAKLLEALRYVHELKDENGKPLGIVHRDVSPDNVTITYDGQVKLGDFGMATTVASAAKSLEERKKGNPAYMAPEQARAEFALDARADVFAVGVIFWELLTGKRLWEGLAEVDVFAKLAEDSELQPPSYVVAGIPEEVDSICKKALTKVRDERYDSASDMLDELSALGKKPELASTTKELGKFVTDLFEDERTKMHALVEEAKATKPEEAGEKALPAVGQPPPSNPSPFVDAESDPRLRFGVATPQEEPPKRVIEVIRVEAPPPDRRFAYVMAAAVIAVIGVVTVLAIRSPAEEKKVEEKPYEAPVRPTAATATPSASAFEEPTEVTIEIRVTPSDAKLFVDGVRTNNPYRTRVVPAQFKHTIRAEADGFEARSTTVAFDKERSIEMALTPEKAKPPPPGKPAPKPAPTAAKPATTGSVWAPADVPPGPGP